MKYFFYFGHPSQFLFQKNNLRILKDNGHQVYLYIKTKDVLQKIIEKEGFPFKNVLPVGRKSNIIGIFWGLIKRNISLAREIIKYKPDLLISSDPSFAQLGFLFRIPSLNFIDDDIDLTGYYSVLTYPFSTVIITPESCRVGRYSSKRISYSGYMKLAYLHPKQFQPDPGVIGFLASTPFYLIRLTKLTAHHDHGIKGISKDVLRNLVSLLSKTGQVFISSESELPVEFKLYQLNIVPSQIHHYLYYAKMLVCDSQSMAGEAAMLGTPSIRISSFAGKLSTLEELEHKYQLTFGILPDDQNKLYDKINELLFMIDLKEEFMHRRQRMLEDKINVTQFTNWLIENYPESVQIMRKNKDFQFKFK